MPTLGSHDTLPDGTPFPFWEDGTDYEHTYHVDGESPAADDDGPGSADVPFETIGAAADRAGPGERVRVHDGVYRECVRPARGGEGPDAMVAYEAAPGESPVVRGTEVLEGFEPGRGWDYGGADVWTARMPADWFVGYNPFLARNLPSANPYYLEPAADGRFTEAEIRALVARRGTVFVDGRPLEQVYYPRELGDGPGFWVEDPGLTLHVRLPEDADPGEATVEVTTREQAFAPEEVGLGYVRVSGFTFERVADGIPVPQRAAVSANLGHHWIVADNRIRQANAYGIDLGDGTWHRRADAVRADGGGHVVRGNHVSDCGACGIAAMHNNEHTLVEENLIERIGGLGIERIWETAGLKFHRAEGVLIRSNTFRHVVDAPSIWLDYLNRNSRVTGNVVADVRAINGAIYLEVSHDPNLIDHNVIWDVRAGDPDGEARPGERGHGVNVDTGEGAVVAHNLIGDVADGFAVAATLDQHDREVDGRVGLCRDHAVANNAVVDCPRRIRFDRRESNRADGNCYDADDDVAFRLRENGDDRRLNLEAWREQFGFDADGAGIGLAAAFDPGSLELTVVAEGDVPRAVAVGELAAAPQTAGPVELEEGETDVALALPGGASDA